MNAPSVWAIVVLGVANLGLIAERWHLTNRVTELADRIAGLHGDRVRVVAPAKQQPAPPPTPPGTTAAFDGQVKQEAHQ